MRTVILAVLERLPNTLVSNLDTFKGGFGDRLPTVLAIPATHVLLQPKSSHYVTTLSV